MRARLRSVLPLLVLVATLAAVGGASLALVIAHDHSVTCQAVDQSNMGIRSFLADITAQRVKSNRAIIANPLSTEAQRAAAREFLTSVEASDRRTAKFFPDLHC